MAGLIDLVSSGEIPKDSTVPMPTWAGSPRSTPTRASSTEAATQGHRRPKQQVVPPILTYDEAAPAVAREFHRD